MSISGEGNNLLLNPSPETLLYNKKVNRKAIAFALFEKYFNSSLERKDFYEL